jgi:hypothetical protein
VARSKLRAAIRKHRVCIESRLLASGNRRSFFKYINNRLWHVGTSTCLRDSNGEVTVGQEAAEALSAEFSSNFAASNSTQVYNASMVSSAAQQLQLSCTSVDVRRALAACSNSAAGPDGLSFKIIKSVIDDIIMPLMKIYQKSLAHGKFPSVWKNANVIPLCKGKGDSSLPSSYRPISLCICLGKLLENVVVEQLTKQINNVRPLSRIQYGFRNSRFLATSTCGKDS